MIYLLNEKKCNETTQYLNSRSDKQKMSVHQTQFFSNIQEQTAMYVRLTPLCQPKGNIDQ